MNIGDLRLALELIGLLNLLLIIGRLIHVRSLRLRALVVGLRSAVSLVSLSRDHRLILAVN